MFSLRGFLMESHSYSITALFLTWVKIMLGGKKNVYSHEPTRGLFFFPSKHGDNSTREACEEKVSYGPTHTVLIGFFCSIQLPLCVLPGDTVGDERSFNVHQPHVDHSSCSD